VKRGNLTALAVLFLFLFSSKVLAQESGTLYSFLVYSNETREFCLNFRSGLSTRKDGGCDVQYGLLRLGDDWDWFQSSTAKGSRSVIRDLGVLTWSDRFKVPYVAALPKLQPGENRVISIDASGAPGKNGAPGQNGASAAPVPPGMVGPLGDSGGFVAVGDPRDGRFDPVRHPLPVVVPPIPPAPGPKPKGHKQAPDSPFVKAVVGHIYVIHVVDDVNDYYALFRVESIDRGASCTLSWKLIDALKRKRRAG
jgi:hypothetical protein